MVPTRPCADAQRRLVHGLALQALGGVELEHAVGAQHIGRADLGHHVGGDLRNDLVEPGLCADRLRHDLAEAAEQDARPGGGPPHVRYPRRFGRKCRPVVARPEAPFRCSSSPYSECKVRTASSVYVRVDQYRYLDFRRRDGADVDALAGQRLETVGGDAGVAAHADADDRDLGDVGRALHRLVADRAPRLLQHLPRALVVGGRHREGHVGLACRPRKRSGRSCRR